MITYSLKLVRKVLEEVKSKHVLTRDLIIKDIKYMKKKEFYLITLANGEKRVLKKELINKYIESAGEDGDLEIAGHLLHSPELEGFQPYEPQWSTATDDYWEGNLIDVFDYIKKRDENDEFNQQK